jgi:hypothetical protein
MPLIAVTEPVHAWLKQVQQKREAELGRRVPMSEIVESLLSIHMPVKR